MVSDLLVNNKTFRDLVTRIKTPYYSQPLEFNAKLTNEIILQQTIILTNMIRALVYEIFTGRIKKKIFIRDYI